MFFGGYERWMLRKLDATLLDASILTQHSRSYALYKSTRKPKLTGKRLKPMEILVKHCVRGISNSTYIKVHHRLSGGPRHILKQLEVTFLGRSRGSSKELLTEK